jgi:SAM-dependent methyltransferase
MLTSGCIRVRGIDASQEAVREARSRGVDTIRADFLDFEDEPFDVILFSQSLHHIHPLDEAVDKASELLKSGGLLIVEDFGVDLADQRTAERRYAMESELKKSGHLIDETSQTQIDGQALLRWRADHLSHPPISTCWQMREALKKKFDIKYEERAPYLYRYALESLAAVESGFSAAQSLISTERLLIERGHIQAIGVRWVSAKLQLN